MSASATQGGHNKRLLRLQWDVRRWRITTCLVVNVWRVRLTIINLYKVNSTACRVKVMSRTCHRQLQRPVKVRAFYIMTCR